MVIVEFGPWEAFDQQVVPGEQFRHLGQPEFEEFARGELDAMVETLTAGGAKVVWLDVPAAGDVAFDRLLAGVSTEDYDARRQRFNELIAELPSRSPGRVVVVRQGDWLEGRRNDLTLRPDGVHLSDDGSRKMAEEWLAREVENAMEELGVLP